MVAVSIHIVTFNSAATIRPCLASIRDQTLNDYQVIVWDNASTDETVQLVRQEAVQIYESTENLGYAAAHNHLINETSSDYVLTLNPDVALAPTFLAEMYNTLEVSSHVGSAAGCLLRVERLGDSSKFIDSAGLGMQRNRRQRLLGENQHFAAYLPRSLEIFGPDGAAAFYRREMLEDIRILGEVFDNDFYMHKEDIDVCWRAQLRGWRSVYAPCAMAQHIRSFRPGHRERVSPYMRYLGTRNRYLLMIKNESLLHFLHDLPFIMIYDFGIFAYVLLRERESLKAYRSLWQLRRRMLQKRKIIQSKRSVDWRTIAQWFDG